ncbi:hypothetical protein [Glutamicibacter sp. X7]
MKLVVSGKEYPLKEGIGKASLGDLYTLKIKSGLGVKRIMQAFQGMKNAESQWDFFEEAENIQALRAMIWLCRRAAGEHVDFDEATSMPLSEIGFIKDEAEVTEADPKATPTDSAAADGEPLAD